MYQQSTRHINSHESCLQLGSVNYKVSKCWQRYKALVGPSGHHCLSITLNSLSTSCHFSWNSKYLTIRISWKSNRAKAIWAHTNCDSMQINGLAQGSFINATLRWGTATMQIASDNINALNMTTVPAGSRNSFTVSPIRKNLLTKLYGCWGCDRGITINAICIILIILAPTSWGARLNLCLVCA